MPGLPGRHVPSGDAAVWFRTRLSRAVALAVYHPGWISTVAGDVAVHVPPTPTFGQLNGICDSGNGVVGLEKPAIASVGLASTLRAAAESHSGAPVPFRSWT